MKRFLLAGCLVCIVWGAARAQGKPANQDLDASGLPEDVLITDAKKNLDAARLYFTRKAYSGTLERCEETIAVYQKFKKFDEMLYLAGVSSLRLARKEGTQPPKLAPEQYLILARQYLTQLIDEHPKSSFRKRAEAELRSLGAVKAQADAKQ